MAYCSRHPGDGKEVNEDGVVPSAEYSMWSKDCLILCMSSCAYFLTVSLTMPTIELMFCMNVMAQQGHASFKRISSFNIAIEERN